MRAVAIAFALTIVASGAFACGGGQTASATITTITADAAPIQTPVPTTRPSGS